MTEFTLPPQIGPLDVQTQAVQPDQQPGWKMLLFVALFALGGLVASWGAQDRGPGPPPLLAQQEAAAH